MNSFAAGKTKALNIVSAVKEDDGDATLSCYRMGRPRMVLPRLTLVCRAFAVKLCPECEHLSWSWIVRSNPERSHPEHLSDHWAGT